MKRFIFSFLTLLVCMPAAFGGREGMDVLDPKVNIQGCHLTSGTDLGLRPGYITNCDCVLKSRIGLPPLYMHIAGSSIAYLERKPRDKQNYSTYPGWLPLSLKEAEQIWGQGRVHDTKMGQYQTFDVFGQIQAASEEEENNLYHIDLQVGKDNTAIAYRVRGIALTNAEWIYPGTLADHLK